MKLLRVIVLVLVLAVSTFAGWIPTGFQGCEWPNQGWMNTDTGELACCLPNVECPFGGPEGRLFTIRPPKGKESEEIFRSIFLNSYKGKLF
jgi:hypothetical protein